MHLFIETELPYPNPPTTPKTVEEDRNGNQQARGEVVPQQHHHTHTQAAQLMAAMASSLKLPPVAHFLNSPVASRTRGSQASKDQAPIPTPTLGDHAQPGIAALAAAASTYADADKSVYGARRGMPRDYVQDQSIRSISSEPLEQTRYDHTRFEQSQHDMTRRISALQTVTPYFGRFNQPSPDPSSSSVVMDAPESPSGIGQRIMDRGRLRTSGRARAFNKGLPRLLDAAKELHDLLSQRGPSMNDPDFVEELEVARDQLAALSRLYRDKASESRFISSIDITTLLSHPPGSSEYSSAKNIICIANLGEFSCSLLSLRAHEAGRVPFELLSQLDVSSFPLDFAPAELFDRNDWKEATIALAVDVRTQLAISKLQAADGAQGSPQKVILDVFCADEIIESGQDVRAILANSSRFKSLPGWDPALFSHPELDVDQIRHWYVARCKNMLRLLGAGGGTVTAQVLDQMAKDFPPGKLVTSLQAWIDETTSDLFETSLESGIRRDPQLSHAQVEFGRSGVSHFGPAPASQESVVSDVSVSEIRDFVSVRDSSLPPATQPRPQPGGDSSAAIAGPSQGQGPSRKRGRAESDAGSSQDDDSDAFQVDRRGAIPDSQLMPPPPRPAPVRRPPGFFTRRPKRVRIEGDVPVDPRLTGPPPPSAGPDQVAAARPSPAPSPTLAVINASTGRGSALPSDDSRYSSNTPMPDVEWLSQQSKAVSLEARQRNPKTPQKRISWSTHDCTLLITAIRDQEARWSKIAAQIKSGELQFDHERDQQALRDKARLLKVDMLKTDQLLSAGFDHVVLGRKERKAVEDVGRNPERREADVENGVPVNTMLPNHNLPEESQLVAASVPAEEQQQQQQEEQTQAQPEERPQAEPLAAGVVD